MIRTLFLIFCLLLALPANAAGNDVAIAKAESYLGTLTTAKARFLQTAQDGTQMIGTFYLSRPGRLRFEYDPPIKDFIVADNYFIYFYDGEMKEHSNAPIGQTLADFLLRPDLKLSGDIKVKNVVQGGGLLQITLVQTADESAGSITLGFEENPMRLKKWRVTDPQGAVTEIELFQMEPGAQIDPALFVFSTPGQTGNKAYNE